MKIGIQSDLIVYLFGHTIVYYCIPICIICTQLTAKLKSNPTLCSLLFFLCCICLK